RSRRPAQFWVFRNVLAPQQEFLETALRACEGQRVEPRRDMKLSKSDSTALKFPLKSLVAKGPPASSAARFPDMAPVWSRVPAVQRSFGREVTACVASTLQAASRLTTTRRRLGRSALSQIPAPHKCPV